MSEWIEVIVKECDIRKNLTLKKLVYGAVKEKMELNYVNVLELFVFSIIQGMIE